MVTTAADWIRHLNQQQLDRVRQLRQAAKTPSPIASPNSSHDHGSLSPIGSPSPKRFVRTAEPLAIPVERFGRSPEPLVSPLPERLASPLPQRTASPSPLRLVRDSQESRSPSPQRTASPGQLRLASPSPQRTATPSPLRLIRDPQESPSPSPQRSASPSPLRLAINPQESPQNSRSPDRLSRNSQESASALPDPFTAPIQVGGDNNVNDELEDDED
jgi:hypothetical protein